MVWIVVATLVLLALEIPVIVYWIRHHRDLCPPEPRAADPPTRPFWRLVDPEGHVSDRKFESQGAAEHVRSMMLTPGWSVRAYDANGKVIS